MTDEIKMQVMTVQYTKGSLAILSHVVMQPTQEPDTDSKLRWIFNLNQIAQQNGLALPEGVAPTQEYSADTEKERDALAKKLLSALEKAQAKAKELRTQVNDAFTSALPPLPSAQDESPDA